MSEQGFALNRPQTAFFMAATKFTAFVSGFGGGKTWVGCAKLGRHFLEFPGVNAGYFAPSYPQIRDIFYPTVEESFASWRLRAVPRVGNHEVEVYRGRRFLGLVKCRSMDDPSSIVGFKIGRALVDEVDVMKQDKATNAWRKIIARMRYKIDGLQNAIDVTTTPEGFRFAHATFVKGPREREDLRALYGLVQASTVDNAMNLPPGYIESLRASYPPQLIDAYINGQFVNMLTGGVYPSFDRRLNNCQDRVEGDETVFIGMDFNVGKMSGIVHVKRGGLPRAVEEIVNGQDTPDMIRRIRERFWRYDGGSWTRTRQVRIYPDASGGSRKSVNASESDISLLRQAGFVVVAAAANPPVKDRINAMNAMFLNAQGERRCLVNVDACPTYADSLEQQAWSESGEPDKKSGHDHANDAGGYFIVHDYPVRRLSFKAHALAGA